MIVSHIAFFLFIAFVSNTVIHRTGDRELNVQQLPISFFCSQAVSIRAPVTNYSSFTSRSLFCLIHLSNLIFQNSILCVTLSRLAPLCITYTFTICTVISLCKLCVHLVSSVQTFTLGVKYRRLYVYSDVSCLSLRSIRCIAGR